MMIPLGKSRFFGTPVYMAPKVFRGEEQGFAADIWSLGCTIIEMATGCSSWLEIHDPVSALYKIGSRLLGFNRGTLDLMLALSDDLLKVGYFYFLVIVLQVSADFMTLYSSLGKNGFLDYILFSLGSRIALLKGCHRQIEDLERVSGVVSSSLTVDGVPVDSYLTRFVWDEAKYPTMSPLREIEDGIHVQVARIEDDLKAQHLTTLIAIVPKYSQKDWLSSYETLTTFVVPRCSKMPHEDNEYALYTVTLFNRDADNFRTKACERNFQILDFEYDPETQVSRRHEIEKLNQYQDASRSSLLQWCYTSYGEVLSFFPMKSC
ncbi:V-type proton ATPase subunit C [Abeliophyllum distichum]|uniref:V-type proton ATPase subunit C n=1 Tax=Abeliophyllum distichum TaxID=126358 RepID=A0ABD1RVH4_9LAMI